MDVLELVIVTALPAFMTRAVWLYPSSELVRAEMPKPATAMPATSATTTILMMRRAIRAVDQWFIEVAPAVLLPLADWSVSSAGRFNISWQET